MPKPPPKRVQITPDMVKKYTKNRSYKQDEEKAEKKTVHVLTNSPEQHVPSEGNYELVANASILGLPEQTIADLIGIPLDWYQWHYGKHYKDSRPLKDVMVVNKLMNHIMHGNDGEGNLTAAMFYLKTRCGWSEKQEIETSQKKEIQPAITINVGDAPQSHDFEIVEE